MKSFAILLVFTACAFAGCSSGGLELAPVQGKVTYQGKPVTHGQVVFTPQDGTPGPQAIGQIQADGSFHMMTNDKKGAAVGPHKVTVHSRAHLTAEQTKALQVGKLLIPARYANEQETPFRFEVKRGGNDCPLELEDEKQ